MESSDYRETPEDRMDMMRTITALRAEVEKLKGQEFLAEVCEKLEKAEAEIAALRAALNHNHLAVIGANIENKELRARAEKAEKERDALKTALEEYKGKTYCAYCGYAITMDDDASKVSDHILVCEKHPILEGEK